MESQEEPVPLAAASDEEDCFQEEISNTSREDTQDKQSDNTKQALKMITLEESKQKLTGRGRPAKEGKTMDVIMAKIVKLQEVSDVCNGKEKNATR